MASWEGSSPEEPSHEIPTRDTTMKTTSPQTYRNEQGQTLTEFAMVLPILLLVLFAVIQLGIASKGRSVSIARSGSPTIV